MAPSWTGQGDCVTYTLIIAVTSSQHISQLHSLIFSYSYLLTISFPTKLQVLGCKNKFSPASSMYPGCLASRWHQFETILSSASYTDSAVAHLNLLSSADWGSILQEVKSHSFPESIHLSVKTSNICFWSFKCSLHWVSQHFSDYRNILVPLLSEKNNLE